MMRHGTADEHWTAPDSDGTPAGVSIVLPRGTVEAWALGTTHRQWQAEARAALDAEAAVRATDLERAAELRDANVLVAAYRELEAARAAVSLLSFDLDGLERIRDAKARVAELEDAATPENDRVIL